MAGVTTYQGHFTTPASGTTVVTGVGFQPNAIIFWIAPSNGVTNNTWANSIQDSCGFAAYDGTNIYNAYSEVVVKYATSGGVTTYLANNNDYCLFTLTTAGALLFTGYISAIGGDGFTITYANFAANYTVFYLAIGGDVDKACIAEWTLDASATSPATTQTVTLPNSQTWTPSLVMHVADNSVDLGLAMVGYTILMFGAMDNAGNQASVFCQSYTESSGNQSVSYRGQSTSYCMSYADGSGNPIDCTLAYSAMGAGSFTVTKGGANYAYGIGLIYCFSLCLHCTTAGEMRVGSWTKSTAAAPVTDTVASGVTTVQGALFFSDNYTAVGEAQGMRFGIGASDGTNNGCMVLTAKDAQTKNTGIAAYSIMETAKCILVADNDSKTTSALASATFSGANMLVAWSTNNAVATEICYIAFGAAATNVTVTGQTAQFTFNAEPALVGANTPAATAQFTMGANAGLVGVGTPAQTGGFGLNAKPSLIGVGTTAQVAGFGLNANPPSAVWDTLYAGATGQATFGANAALIGVSTPAQTADATFGANPALIGVGSLGATAQASMDANYGLVGVGTLGQIAQTSFDANPTLIDVGVIGQTATCSFDANAPLIGVGLTGCTAELSFDANLPLIDVSACGQTALTAFNANVGIVVSGGGDVTVMGLTADFSFDANPTLIDVGIESQTAQTSFDANPSLIDVGVTAQTAETSFNANLPLIDVGANGATAQAHFDANVANAVWDVLIEGDTAFISFDANTALVGVGTESPTASFEADANASIVSIGVLGQTAETSFTAHVPLIDVSVIGQTADFELDANAAVTLAGHDVTIVGLTAVFDFDMNVPTVYIGTAITPIELIGSSSQVITLVGSSSEAIDVEGSSSEELELIGSSTNSTKLEGVSTHTINLEGQD